MFCQKSPTPVHRSAIPDQDRQFLQSLSSSLADNLPDTSEKASVDLLIGTDYFWSIIQQDRIVLPSGLLLLPSRLGYILTGCCAPSHDDSAKHPHCCVTPLYALPPISSK